MKFLLGIYTTLLAAVTLYQCTPPRHMFGAQVLRSYTSPQTVADRLFSSEKKRPGIIGATDVVSSLFAAASVPFSCAQIFIRGPRDRKKHPIPSLSPDIMWFVHDAYVDSLQPGAFSSQMTECDRLGVTGFIVHEPSHLSHLDFAFNSRSYAALNARTVLFVETTAFADGRYASTEHINSLVSRYSNRGVPFGVCIDTAHLWTGGAAIRRYEDAVEWLKTLAETCPLIMHLNDSLLPRGVGPDAHACLMRGRMWGALAYRESGLRAFIEYAQRRSCPVILERSSLVELETDLALLKLVA